ncbi:MAG: penicillin-binding protein 2 [Nitrospirales bacterium]|nr:penicillin-binding protein 2 [Nitrospira sp.]MDR4500471.1 penicillin-binding protein 2 [Nitrospirales bacterium]
MNITPDGVSQSCRVRTAIVCLGFLVGFTIIFSRLFFLQVVQSNKGALQAQGQHFESIEVKGNRGLIVDRHGSTYAINVDAPSVYARKKDIQQQAHVLRKLSTLIDVPVSSLRKKMKGKGSSIQLKRKLTSKEVEAIQASNLPGITVKMESQRFYPKGTSLAHLLGFAGRDSQGLEGLEWHFDSYLQGKKQTVQFQRDASRGRIALVSDHGLRPYQGFRITLTIDEVIQFIAEQELDDAMRRTKAKRGTVLIMDPNTGAILAWALRPVFDPNHYQDWPRELYVNRAVTDPYEPGSTLKVLLAAAALNEGKKTPDELIYCGDGEMSIAGTKMHDLKQHGWMTLKEAVTHSSNICMVKVALSLGAEKVYDYLRAFGFGQKTEIDLPGESAGLLKAIDDWDGLTLSSLAIGQGISVTPIQLLTAISAVANGGSLYRPFVVSRVEDPRGNLVMEQNVQMRREPITYETSEMLKEMLANVVSQGTGKQAALMDYEVGGKTGTAQKAKKGARGYSSTKFIGSFVGFVPVDQPQLAILVVIDEPEGKGYGGEVAAPVFRKVAEKSLQHLMIAPKHGGFVRVAGLF